MTLPGWTRSIPIVSKVGEKTLFSLLGFQDQRKLSLLEDTPYRQGAQIKRALSCLNQPLPETEQALIDGIERQRRSLFERDEPLVDGTLGEGGIYDTGVTVKQAVAVSKRAKPALMLYSLVRCLRPNRVIELGTNVGISSAFLATALKANNGHGKIATLESSPYRQRIAKELHTRLGLDNVTYIQGLFADTLSDSLDILGEVDLAFIDGHHQYAPTLNYFQKILEFSSPGAVFVFDDIRWSGGMKRAWSELRADTRLGLVVDLYSVGIGVRAGVSSPERYVFPPIYNALR